MKKVTHLAAGAVIAISTLMAPSAFAEVSANVGWTSEYYYRGILQKSSSASAGVDFENEGFYIGTWAADVGDGIEVDGYFGYGIETDEGFSASVGFTGYYYTGEFDDTYQEINLNLGYSVFGLEYSVGDYENFGGPEQDYSFVAATLTGDNGWYGTIGSFGKDFDGEYLEVGYGTEIGGFDVGVAAIFSSEELSDELESDGSPDRSEAIIFSIGKSF